jgi:trehalose 6-phosphate phosphatase
MHPARSALFLDLDGTLAPIVAHPHDARVIGGVHEVLVRLRDYLGIVGFISGRGIGDLRRIVDIPGCAYAGNHGFELQLPDRPPTIAAAAEPWLGVIAGLAEQWDHALDPNPGMYVEPKGATLSVHWRMAPDPEAAHALLRERYARDAQRRGLAVSWGRMVMEVRPPVAVDKGTAVRELLGAGDWRHAAYVGDDRTDADAWRALHVLRDAGSLMTAIAVIATSPETPAGLLAAADAAVGGPSGVLELLTVLAHTIADAR